MSHLVAVGRPAVVVLDEVHAPLRPGGRILHLVPQAGWEFLAGEVPRTAVDAQLQACARVHSFTRP